jgi:pilus assembly protein CpaE
MESIRSRPPALVLAPFGDKLSEMSNLARELSTSSPPIPLVAIFRPYGFGDDVSESGVLIDALRAGVRDFLRRPVSTTELRTLIDNLADGVPRSGDATDRTFGRVVTFISNKGGVGKSTLAVNAAVGLALRHPGRVLLIDASLQMGVASSLLDVQPESTLTDLAHERDRLDGTMIRQLATAHPSGLSLLAAPRDAIDAIDVDDTLIARVITLGAPSVRLCDHRHVPDVRPRDRGGSGPERPGLRGDGKRGADAVGRRASAGCAGTHRVPGRTPRV